MFFGKKKVVSPPSVESSTSKPNSPWASKAVSLAVVGAAWFLWPKKKVLKDEIIHGLNCECCADVCRGAVDPAQVDITNAKHTKAKG